jgi:hypothetical protein
MWATPDESSEYIIGLNRRACAHADGVIVTLDLPAPGSVAHWPEDRRSTTLGVRGRFLGAEQCRDESRDRAGANRPSESFVNGLVFTLEGVTLARRKPGVKRHRTEERSELVRRVLEEPWQDRRLDITEQATRVILRYVVAAEPGPYR